MMCYKDQTFCPYYLICKTWQNGDCDKAATPDVISEAKEWTKTVTDKDIILIMLYDGFPGCFIGWFR